MFLLSDRRSNPLKSPIRGGDNQRAISAVLRRADRQPLIRCLFVDTFSPQREGERKSLLVATDIISSFQLRTVIAVQEDHPIAGRDGITLHAQGNRLTTSEVVRLADSGGRYCHPCRGQQKPIRVVSL
jgi:hypothetical protein